jgi:hypothetical protein
MKTVVNWTIALLLLAILFVFLRIPVITVRAPPKEVIVVSQPVCTVKEEQPKYKPIIKDIYRDRANSNKIILHDSLFPEHNKYGKSCEILYWRKDGKMVPQKESWELPGNWEQVWVCYPDGINTREDKHED